MGLSTLLPSPQRWPGSFAHLFELTAGGLHWHALVGGSDAPGAAGALVPPVPFPEGHFGGALELGVQLPIGRGRG